MVVRDLRNYLSHPDGCERVWRGVAWNFGERVMNRAFFLPLAAALFASGANAALITNGGFEDPVVPANAACCLSYSPSSPLPGWSVSGGGLEIVRGTTFASSNLAQEGDQYLDLVGVSGNSGIAQSFATVLGQSYTLSFAYSHNIFGGLPSASAAFSVGDLAGIVTHFTGSTSDLDWQLFSQTFTATGSASTLSFANTVGSSDGGIFLDAISVVPNVSAVPEASTWAMMIVGFGAIGGALRRRRRPSTAEPGLAA